MTLSPRERLLAGGTVAAMLFAVLIFAYDGQIKALRAAQTQLRSRQTELRFRKMLIGQRPALEARYARLKDLMPVFSADKQVDTHWMGIMNTASKRNGLTLINAAPEKETQVGDVYEFPIKCSDFNGSLDALVRFLHDVQNEGVMLDVRNMTISIHPQNPALLRGQFTLYCAYMRESAQPPESAQE
jgi:Tfp pilus assembly protein PilO